MEKDWLNLCKNHSDTFDEWFDSDKFNWENYSYSLTMYCSRHFDKWFNKEKFHWENYSGYLTRYCSEHFDTWWDGDKYNWLYPYYIVKYCPEHILRWYPTYPNKNELDLTPVQIAQLRVAGLI